MSLGLCMTLGVGKRMPLYIGNSRMKNAFGCKTRRKLLLRSSILLIDVASPEVIYTIKSQSVLKLNFDKITCSF